MITNKLGRAVAMLTVSVGLVGAGCGVASAAPPTHPPKAAVRGSVGSSLGIGFYNNSSYNLVLQSVSGPNEGVPSVGTTLTSGKGLQDFEVTFRAAKTTTVTAQYAAKDNTGATVGTATVSFSVDALGARSVTGSSALPVKTDYVGGGNWELEDSTATTTTIDASDSVASTVVQQYCNDSDNSATCTFAPASNVKATESALVASGYTDPGGDGSPSTISVSDGYDSGASVNTGGSVSAGLKLGKVFSLSIQEAYGQTLAFDTTFSASEAIDVDPGDTGYIWGNVPVIKYTGTMKIVVGNTTWNITNMVLTSPDTSRALSSFITETLPGYYPIGKPSQPPTNGATSGHHGHGHPGHRAHTPRHSHRPGPPAKKAGHRQPGQGHGVDASGPSTRHWMWR